MLRSLVSVRTWAAAAAMLLLAMPGFALDVPRKIGIESNEDADKLIEDVVLDEEMADAVKVHAAEVSAATP